MPADGSVESVEVVHPSVVSLSRGTAHGILGFLVMLILVTVTLNSSTKRPPGKYPQDQFAHGCRSDKVTQLRREKITACLQIRCWVR